MGELLEKLLLECSIDKGKALAALEVVHLGSCILKYTASRLADKQVQCFES